jgi:hypothetical protein
MTGIPSRPGTRSTGILGRRKLRRLLPQLNPEALGTLLAGVTLFVGNSFALGTLGSLQDVEGVDDFFFFAKFAHGALGHA